MYRRLIALLTIVLAAPLWADDALFESDAPLAFDLTGPLRTMSLERDKSKAYPGQLQLGDKVLNVELTMRGNRRLDKTVCKYPPLKLAFNKDETKDTLFEKQKDIKLVVQCSNGSRYDDYLRTEFLIYKAFNLVTPANYRVRWVTVTYKDSEHGGDYVAPAFLIERKARLAKRLGLETTDVARIKVSELDAYQAALAALFEYMVANPDYSMLVGPPGDECCHNAKLLMTPSHTYLPVIYDFDNTGVVDAKYAIPPDGLPIRSAQARAAHAETVRRRSGVGQRREESRQTLYGALVRGPEGSEGLQSKGCQSMSRIDG